MTDSTKHAGDRERYVAAIERWVAYIESEPPEVWGSQQNATIDDEEIYVGAAVDCETLEMLAVEVLLGRSNIDVSLFLDDVLERFAIARCAG